jgi:hypothetical protein
MSIKGQNSFQEASTAVSLDKKMGSIVAVSPRAGVNDQVALRLNVDRPQSESFDKHGRGPARVCNFELLSGFIEFAILSEFSRRQCTG